MSTISPSLLWYYLHVYHFGCHAVYLAWSCLILSYLIRNPDLRTMHRGRWWRVKPELLSVPLPCCLPACVCPPMARRSPIAVNSKITIAGYSALGFRVNHGGAMTRAFRVHWPFEGNPRSQGRRWLPSQRANNADLWFIRLPEQDDEQSSCHWYEMPWRQYAVTLLYCNPSLETAVVV